MRLVVAGAIVVAALLAAGCGSGGGESSYVAIDGSESKYCDTVRGWTVHELDSDPSNPTALKTYWNQYLGYLGTAREQSPPILRDQQAVVDGFSRNQLTPVLEKYGFDEQRFGKQATAAEQALLGDPPPDVQKAGDAINSYHAEVCGTDSPPAADAVFKASGSSKAFCAANAAFFGEFDKVGASRFDPEVMRTFVTGDSFSEGLDALNSSAPPEIADDIDVVTDWFRTRWSDVVASFDYDFRHLLLDGTPEDRAVFTRFHPDVVKQWSRAKAYSEQVCSR